MSDDYVKVPKVASDVMIRAGIDARSGKNLAYQDAIGRNNKDKVVDMWDAMVEAAQQEK